MGWKDTIKKASWKDTIQSPKEPTSGTSAALEGFKQGGSLGLSDEAGGVIDALLSKTGNLFVPEGGKNPYEDKSIGQVYKEGRDEERVKSQIANKDHPGIYNSTALASGALTTLPASGLKAALAIGGTAGFGSSNKDSATGLALDTAKGAGIAGLGSKLGDLVGSIISKARTATPIVSSAEGLASGITGLPKAEMPSILRRTTNELPAITAKSEGLVGNGLKGLAVDLLSGGATHGLAAPTMVAKGLVQSPTSQQMTQKGLQTIAPTLKSADKTIQTGADFLSKGFQKLQPQYQTLLKQASDKGGRSLAITHFLLGQNDPNYQEAFKEGD